MSPVLELLCELVALPSVNPGAGEPDELHGESRVVRYIADWLSARKLDYELQEVLPGRHNLLTRLEGGSGPSLVFEAHTDTVGVQNMDIPPFSPTLQDGRIYGRGACDCKASLAAMLWALTEIAATGAPPGTLTFVAACDEEYRYRGVKQLVESGFRADGAIVGEPTQLQLVIAHKGALRAKISTKGRAAHSSQPEQGENAIFYMAEVLKALQEYAQSLRRRPSHPLLGSPTLSVGQIVGGLAPNVVPDYCEINIDRRVLPAEDLPQVEAEIRQWLEKHAPVPWEMEIILADVGLESRPDSPLVTSCRNALKRLGFCSDVVGVPFGTDASKFAHSGTPAVVFGPGNIAHAHTAVEWIETQQVEQAAEVYRLMALEFFQHAFSRDFSAEEEFKTDKA